MLYLVRLSPFRIALCRIQSHSSGNGKELEIGKEKETFVRQRKAK